jgi:ATP-dependent DNA helicase RecQ
MKRALEDIVEAKGLEMPELISEIEAIVNSGTRINLDYYIDKAIDEERQHDIYSYFREEAESDSLEDAINELGNEFEEEEIRLVRIKFLSEMGN